MGSRLKAAERGTATAALVSIALVAVAAGLATGARAAEPSLGTVVATSPDGSQNASGSVAGGGRTDACVNDQHSALDPLVSAPGGAATLNEGARGASGGSHPSGSAPTAGRNGSQGSGSGSSATTTDSSRTRIVSIASRSTSRTSVSAAAARGLRIARVAFFTDKVPARKRQRVVVALRDLNGRSVRNAIVAASPVAAKRTIPNTKMTFSNRLGQAQLVLGTTKRMLGRRVLIRITARTPSARAVTVGSVLPGTPSSGS
jgi:hypothetical protein